MSRGINETAISTISYYPKWYKGELKNLKDTQKIRGDLALKLFHQVNKADYQLVLVDGGSAADFIQELSQFKSLKLIQHKHPKRSPLRRQAIKAAAKLSKVRVIVMTEPEKVDLIKSIPKIVEPILESKAEIVVPIRENKLFKSSFPKFQYQSEIKGNQDYNKLLRNKKILKSFHPDFDWFFGPKALVNQSQTLKLFLERFESQNSHLPKKYRLFDAEDFSNTVYLPVVRALKQGVAVESIEISFTYPLLQQKNEISTSKTEFKVKRTAQRLILLSDLRQFLALA